jgi:hypothetical protein
MDLSTPSGRMVARMLGATARFESEHKAERARRKHRELAEAGKPTGGGDRPFGFEDDRVTHRPGEAALIRAAVEHILQGGSVRSVWADWRDRGIRTPRGGEWSKTSLRRMLSSPRIAGLRENRGVTVGPAVWEPIITKEQHEAIRAVFTANAARDRSPSRKYLLTGGMARCGSCGAAMVARPNGKGQRRYACTADHGGCNRVFVLADPLEDLVRDAVFQALDSPALRKAREASAEDTDEDFTPELDAIEARRREAVEAYGSGAISLASFQAIDRDLTARADGVRDRLVARVRSGVAAELPTNAEALQSWWNDADLDLRRQLLSLVLESVEIGSAVRGRNRFDPDRITLQWRA